MGGSFAETDEDDVSTLSGELAVFIVVDAALFGAGYAASSLYVLRSCGVAARGLFGLSFAGSCALLLLLLMEVVHPFRFRRLLWRGHLLFHLVLLVLVLPWCQLQHACGAATMGTRAVACVLLVGWLWLFWQIGSALPMMEADPWASGVLWAVPALCLSRAALIGVTVTAFMSGYGAVAMPWTTISRLLNPVDEAEVRESVRAVQHALRTLHQRSSQLAALQQQLAVRRERDAAHTQAQADSGRSWFAAAMQVVPLRLRSNSYRWARRGESAARAETSALVHALRSRCARLDELLREKERAAFATTVRGRVMNRCGWFFAAYCGYKFVSAATSILLLRTPGVDPVTKGMIVVRLLRGGDVPAAIRALVRPPLDLHDGAWEAEAFWSESISLVLVGAMIFSSVRGFLTQASRSMSSLTSHIQGRRSVSHISHLYEEDDLLVYVIAHVQGFYFLSVVLLVRASLPAAYRRGLSEAGFGGLEWRFYHSWFDLLFLAAASATLAIFAFSRYKHLGHRRLPHHAGLEAATRLRSPIALASSQALPDARPVRRAPGGLSPPGIEKGTPNSALAAAMSAAAAGDAAAATRKCGDR